MDFGPLIDFVVAAGTGVGFFIYGRRLKRQQLLINQLTMAKALRTDDADTSADVVVELHKDPGNNFLCVKNIGPIPALEVQVEIYPDVRNRPREFPFPMRLESGQSVPVSISRGISNPDRVMVKVWWNDSNHPGRNSYKEFDTPLFS